MLIEETELYFDLSKIFVESDDIYGFIDSDDYTSAITNSDTVEMDNIEFNDLEN